jgi:phage tail tape-measure protein
MSDTIQYRLLLSDSFSNTFSKLQSKGSAAFAKLDGSVSKFQSKLNGVNTRHISSNIDSLNSKLDDLRKTRNLSIDTRQIRSINREIEQTERKINKLETKGTSGGGMIGGMLGGMLTGGAILGAGIGLGSEVIRVRGERERLEAVLTNTYKGDNTRARMDMESLNKMASSTPFQVTELTDSFVKLSNQGFKPNMDKMKNLGDLASYSGKSFDQLSEAILDARMGEFERLKEFGVKARVQGDMISMTFNGSTTKIKNTTTAIDEYLLSLGKQEGVANSMASISKTLNGSLSNLGDSWDNLLNTIGKSDGVFKSAVSSFSDFLNDISWAMTSQKDKVLSKQASSYDYEKEGIQKYYKTLTEKLKMPQKEALEAVGKYIDEGIKMKTGGYLHAKGGLIQSNESYDKMQKVAGMTGMTGMMASPLISFFKKNGSKAELLASAEGDLKAQQKLKLDYINLLTGTGAEGAGSSTGASKTGLGSKTESVVSDARSAKNITISIGKLVETLQVTAATITESGSQIEAEITKVLLTAVNDANLAM